MQAVALLPFVIRFAHNGEAGPDYAIASSGKILFLSVAFPDDVFKYFPRRRAVPFVAQRRTERPGFEPGVEVYTPTTV